MAADLNSFRYTMADARTGHETVVSQGEDSVTKQELFRLVWKLAERLHQLDSKFQWPTTDELDADE